MPRKKIDIIPAPSPNEFYLERLRRVQDTLSGKRPISEGFAVRRSAGTPVRAEESRSQLKLSWMSFEDRIMEGNDAGKIIDPKASKVKFSKKEDYVGTYYGFNGILRPEYDMLEPFVLFDVEPYLRQAINRRISLMFRNGFEISSDLPQYSNYIKNRLDTMAYVRGTSTESFFKYILWMMSLCSNVFLRKIRHEEGSTGKAQENNGNKIPVAGYTVIPAHSIFPYLERGVLKKWRRLYNTGMPFEDYSLEEIVHLKWDVKPGHIFGTPRTVGIRDDIFALRRLEENIELLFVNHLFPLFHVKVGTEKAPCGFYSDGASEIDFIRQQIETMPKEGVFVSDERVEVDAVGSEGKSLETKEQIAHLKGRIYTGLGMSPIDMGESDTSNRSTAESVSQVLKDAIKNDLDTFGGLIRYNVFKEFFQEAPMSLSVQGAVSSTKIEFHEIDLDNKVKEETHAMGLYNSSLVTHPEARKRMKMKPLEKKDYKDTHYEQHEKDLATHTIELKAEKDKELTAHDTQQQKELLTHQTKEGSKQAGTEMEVMKAKGQLERTTAHARTKVLHAKIRHAQAVGTSAKKGSTPTKKSTANKTNPTNQHGRNTSPHKARSSKEVMELMYDRLCTAHALWDQKDHKEWQHLSSTVVEGILLELNEDAENSYTRQTRMDVERLRSQVTTTTDLDILHVLLMQSEDKVDDRTQVELDSATEDFGEDLEVDSSGPGLGESDSVEEYSG